MMFASLPDDHIETATLRKYAPDAKCLVVGAYKGATMRYLLDHGAAHVTGFEPQMWAYEECLASLAPLKYEGRYTVHPYALVPWEVSNDYAGAAYLETYHTDAARLLAPGVTPSSYVFVVSAINAMEFMSGDDAETESHWYDFAVINCEGSEYMLFSYLAPCIETMLVQFHGPAPLPCYPHYLTRRTVGKNWYLYL